MHERELRSTEAALELLDSFKPLRTRGIIRQQMLSKSLDILQQFGRELDATTNIFNMHKARCASSVTAPLLPTEAISQSNKSLNIFTSIPLACIMHAWRLQLLRTATSLQLQLVTARPAQAHPVCALMLLCSQLSIAAASTHRSWHARGLLPLRTEALQPLITWLQRRTSRL